LKRIDAHGNPPIVHPVSELIIIDIRVLATEYANRVLLICEGLGLFDYPSIGSARITHNHEDVANGIAAGMDVRILIHARAQC
jgi:hypothetical protein